MIHYLLRELDPRIKEDEFSIHRKVKTVNRLLTVMEEDIKLEEQANALIHRGGRLMSPTGGNSIPRVNKNLDIPGNLGLLLKKIIKRYKLTTTDINEIRTEMFQRTSGEKEEELKTTATIGIQVENIEHNFEEIQEEGTINVLKLFIQKRKKTELNISDTGQIISPMAPNIVFSMLEEFVEDKLKKEFKTKDVKESNFGGFVYENFLVKFGLKSLALTGFQSMHLVHIYNIYIFRQCKRQRRSGWNTRYCLCNASKLTTGRSRRCSICQLFPLFLNLFVCLIRQ